jgi:hypothetical protein
VKYLCYILGVLIVFPLKILSVGSVNYKFDEILLVCIFVILFCTRGIAFRPLVYCGLIFLYLAYGALAILDSGLVINYQVYFRLLQIVLIIVVVSMMSDGERVKMLDGIASWGPVLALCIVFYLIFILDYSFDLLLDNQQYYKDFFNGKTTFLSVHINTVGTILLLSIYLNLLKFQVTRNKVYVLLSAFMLLPSIMLLSKGDLLAILIALVFFCFSKLKMSYLFFVCLAVGGLIAGYGLNLAKFDSTREALYSTALQAFISNPHGYGIGTERQVIFASSGINYPAHNFLLSAALETGVLGVIFFLALILYSYLRNKDSVARAFLIAFVVVGSFGNVMYFYKYHFVFFIIINGFYDRAYCQAVALRGKASGAIDTH